MPFAGIVRPDSLKRCGYSTLEPKGEHRESAHKYQLRQRNHDDISGGYSASDQVVNDPDLNMSETFKTGVAASYSEATRITVDIELELPKKIRTHWRFCTYGMRLDNCCFPDPSS